MFRFVVICGCLMAIVQAGIISGGLITGVPVAVQPRLTYRPSAAVVSLPSIASASSSNINHGIGSVRTVLAEKGQANAAGLFRGIEAFGIDGIGLL